MKQNPFSEKIFTNNALQVMCFINLICKAMKFPQLLILKLNFILMHKLIGVKQIRKNFLKSPCERVLTAPKFTQIEEFETHVCLQADSTNPPPYAQNGYK